MIKSRRMRWAGHVARMGEKIGVYRVLVGKLREKDNLEDPGVDGRIILTRICQDVSACTRSIWLMVGTVGGRL